VVGGQFTTVGGQARNRIARLVNYFMEDLRNLRWFNTYME
jgi:hypothetical protein